MLIGTGMIFWVQSRQKRHEKQGARSGRAAEAFAIASTTGLLIATLGFLIANRLLPPDLIGRASKEVWIFHAVWIAAAIHAGLRGHAAWREQCWLIAAGCLAAVTLNAMTTPDHLPSAMIRGLWHTAGVDMALFVSAALAAAAASMLRRRARSVRPHG